MKLKTLEITNFRCFESLSMDFDEQLTVLVAKNGQGKTSILDAIRIGLWSFVSGFDLARNQNNDSGNNISFNDLRLIQDRIKIPCKITLSGYYNDYESNNDLKEISWTRCKEVGKTKDDKNSKLIKSLAAFAQNLDDMQYLDDTDVDSELHIDADINLPVIGYYGTGRLWNQKRLTKNKKLDLNMRLFAYSDCLDSASSYKSECEKGCNDEKGEHLG